MHNTQYLVVGATGKTGRRVADKLSRNGFSVKRASRSGDTKFDWKDKYTWSAVLSDVHAAYVTYYPDLAIPGALEDISAFCEVAKEQGVKHITLLSGRGENLAQECENVIKKSGVTWTVIRSSWFAQNFSEGLFRQFLLKGEVKLPVGEVKEPFIDIDDIAEIAFNSMLDDKHHGKLYEVTGPELLSFRELIEQINAVLRQNIKFTSTTLDEFSNEMVAEGVDEGTISMLAYLFTEVLDGRNEFIANGVFEALGRNPTTFKTFLLKNHSLFVE